MTTDTQTTALPPVVGCEFCGARIRWVHTAATGANMPVDAEPDRDKGNQLRLPSERVMAQLKPEIAAIRRAEGTPLYLYHGVRCVRTRRMATQAPRPVERRDPPASVATRTSALELARQALGGKPRRRKARR